MFSIHENVYISNCFYYVYLLLPLSLPFMLIASVPLSRPLVLVTLMSWWSCHAPILFMSHRLSWYSVTTRRDFSCEYTCLIVHSTPSPLYTYLNIVLFSFAYHALRSSFVCLYERKEIFSWVNGLHGFFCGITQHPPSLYIPASPCHVLVSVSFRSSPFFRTSWYSVWT